MSYKIAFTVFAKPTQITILLTFLNGAMRTAIKAIFCHLKVFAQNYSKSRDYKRF